MYSLLPQRLQMARTSIGSIYCHQIILNSFPQHSFKATTQDKKQINKQTNHSAIMCAVILLFA